MAKYVAKPVIIEAWSLVDNEPRPPWVSDDLFETLINYSYDNDLDGRYIVRQGEDDEYPFFMSKGYLEEHYELFNEEKEA